MVIYNEHRPHRSLDRRTPAVVYNLLPKAAPGHGRAGAHIRVRYDRVDVTGSISLRRAARMHHIGIGRAHGGTRVVLLIADLDIRVIDRDTGELIRHLQLDPRRGYQPRFDDGASTPPPTAGAWPVARPRRVRASSRSVIGCVNRCESIWTWAALEYLSS